MGAFTGQQDLPVRARSIPAVTTIRHGRPGRVVFRRNTWMARPAEVESAHHRIDLADALAAPSATGGGHRDRDSGHILAGA